MISKGGDDAAVSEMLSTQMGEIYRIVSICLGIPPKTFSWEYYDKSKAYHKVGPLTPLEFYNEHVKATYNVEDKVRLGTLLSLSFNVCYNVCSVATITVCAAEMMSKTRYFEIVFSNSRLFVNSRHFAIVLNKSRGF